jgi:hypothetical protein
MVIDAGAQAREIEQLILHRTRRSAHDGIRARPAHLARSPATHLQQARLIAAFSKKACGAEQNGGRVRGENDKLRFGDVAWRRQKRSLTSRPTRESEK